MRVSLSDLCELVGLIRIAVAVGALCGAWWGVLVGGVELVLLGVATGRSDVGAVPAGDG